MSEEEFLRQAVLATRGRSEYGIVISPSLTPGKIVIHLTDIHPLYGTWDHTGTSMEISEAGWNEALDTLY